MAVNCLPTVIKTTESQPELRIGYTSMIVKNEQKFFRLHMSVDCRLQIVLNSLQWK